MRELNLCAAVLFGLLTLCGMIVLIAWEAPAYDDALVTVEAICAAFFFYFLHALNRDRTRQVGRRRTVR